MTGGDKCVSGQPLFITHCHANMLDKIYGF